MNHFVFMGRLTRDPETRQTTSGHTVTRYRLAVDRYNKNDNNGPSADFFDCVAWDKAGEFAARYFTKGLRVLVSGRVETGTYTDRDGVTRNTWTVVVASQEFADGKRDPETQRGAQTAPQSAPKSTGNEWLPDNVDDDGLPFV